MKNRFGLTIFCLLAGSWSITAHALSVNCPTNVRTAKPFDVEVTFSNDKCFEPLTVERIMVGLAGNKSGAINLQGPFNINLNPALVVPPAVCNQQWPFITPGKVTKKVRIIGSTPVTLAGKIALAYVEVLDPEGKGKGGDACLVEVVR